MAKKYEIQTMQKDIEKLKKKPKLVGKLPGAPLPPEPIESFKKSESIKSTEPIKPIKPIITPEPKKKQGRKIFIPIILIIAALLIAGGFYYWWNYLRVPEKSELEIPVFLVGTDEIEIIELLEINIPANVSNNLGEKYTFFLYAQSGGNRAGFIVEITDQELLRANLRNWENTMEEDLKPIFLNQELGEPATEEFQGSVYKDIGIRYLNFSNSSLSIDYAIVENYMIVTTSKESIYKMIDRIL